MQLFDTHLKLLSRKNFRYIFFIIMILFVVSCLCETIDVWVIQKDLM